MPLVLLTAAAFAGTFDLTVGELVLDPSAATIDTIETIGTIGVTNTGSDPILVRGTAFSAAFDGTTTPTDDLAVSPPHLTIRPGETADLLVTPIRGASAAERAYEVVVEELHLGVGYAELPVFVRGTASATLALDVRAVMSEGYLSVDVHNIGDAHLGSYAVDVVGSDARTFAAHRRRGVMLSGASRREVFHLPPAACASLTSLDVRITSDAGTSSHTVPVDVRACARFVQASL